MSRLQRSPRMRRRLFRVSQGQVCERQHGYRGANVGGQAVVTAECQLTGLFWQVSGELLPTGTGSKPTARNVTERFVFPLSHQSCV